MESSAIDPSNPCSPLQDPARTTPQNIRTKTIPFSTYIPFLLSCLYRSQSVFRLMTMVFSVISTETRARLQISTEATSPQSASPEWKSSQLQDPASKYDGFFWTYTEEPHRTRRQAIIRAHPEVTKLCGPEPLTKYLVVLVVLLQIYCAYALSSIPILSWRFFMTAYIVGATANQNLFLSIHEISHNLAFRSASANRAIAILANLPIGIPYSASFRPYHLTHHKSLGVDGLDADLPTPLEAIFLDSLLGKAFFCTFQILFYAIRPMFVYQVPLTKVHFANIVVQLAFDACLVRACGANALVYLILSSFLAGSLHPCAAHFIAEHYVFDAPATVSKQPSNVPIPETYSYYGGLNFLTYNVGYHNEHHDFPAVPWSRLPSLHKIAKEFYEPLPHHKSWTLVLWKFILDKQVGLWCRVKRAEGGRLVGSWKESEVQN